MVLNVEDTKLSTNKQHSLSDGPVSGKASRQGGATLSRSEAEFVRRCKPTGQEVLYLRALLRGFAYQQHSEAWSYRDLGR